MTDRLIVDVSAIEKRVGSQRSVEGGFRLPGLQLSTAAVVDDEVEVDLEVEAMIDGLVVSGTVAASWTGPCRRCLDEVVEGVRVEVHEIFERANDEGETYPIDDEGTIDLEPLVREAVMLALPLAPLCGDSCAGPAPDSYPATVVGEGEAGSERRSDPRWAALDEITW